MKIIKNSIDNKVDSSENKGIVIGSQHRGLGKRLVNHAETIGSESNYNTILIISGVGVRDYYRKLGYELNQSYYMEKKN